MKTELLQVSADNLTLTANLLKNGSVVAFRTDTVYGVGCDPFNAEAIDKLFEAKSRSLEKGLPVLLSDIVYLEKVAVNISSFALEMMQQHWPGALTVILPKHDSLPHNLTPTDTIAVRIPDDAQTRELIELAGGVVATTSANKSGDPAANTAQEAFVALEGRISAVLDSGSVDHAQASTIIDCTVSPARLLRQGPIEIPVAER